MQQLFIYLLKVIGVCGLLLLYYIIALRNKKFHYYNRFYLLFTIALSVVLPLLQLSWFTFSSSSAKAINIYKIIYQSGGENFLITGKTSFNWQQTGFILSICFSALLLLQLVLSINKIYRLKKVYPVRKLGEFDFVNTDLPSAPFSFLKNIFWRNDIQFEESLGRQILQHEIVHIKQKHSLDKIFVQLMLCFYWINPFFWWLKKELYLIHEFIADEKSLENNNAAVFAKMLLTAKLGKFNFLPAQPFFYSSIKRRLIMITTSKKTQLHYLRRIMALPLLAGVLCLFAFKLNEQKNSSNIKAVITETNFKLVVDAGHGGKDNGAIGNGLYEKNVALKIAQKIKDLSSQYGIDVLLTRDQDVFMPPQEKSNFANTQNADAFISIHINMNDAEQPHQSGFEVYISNANDKFLSNNEILGSAILQNLKADFKITPAIMQRQVGIWVLKNSNIPSALIECGYITNADDAKNLKNDAKIELIAQHILQGVAMYANNKIDKSEIYQIQNDDTTVPDKSNSMASPKTTPLYVLDGKIVSKSVIDKTAPSSIESINILKDKSATDKYGDKGKNGVIVIALKDAKDPKPPINPPTPPAAPNTAPVPPLKVLKDTLIINTRTKA